MKVSVYCLVYNHSKYLDDALRGFVQQKANFEYEVIVHDDASTDNSKEIIEKYVREYPNIIKPIYETENQYSKGTRFVTDIIFPTMTGDYVAVCEGDDYWCDENKLQLQYDFMEEHKEYSACVHNTLKKNLFDGTESIMYNSKGDYDIAFEDVVKCGSQAFHTSSIFYRREYMYRPDFFEKAMNYTDYPMAMYLALGGKIRFIDRVMSVYRNGTEGSFSVKIEKVINKAIGLADSRIALLEAIDEYSNRRYTDIIASVILQNEYDKLILQENFNAVLVQPYKDIFDNYPFVYRVKIRILRHVPRLHQVWKRIKYKNNC